MNFVPVRRSGQNTLQNPRFCGTMNAEINKRRDRSWQRSSALSAFTQGALQITEIWVDKETGVNDLFHASGNAGGLTPLLDRDGKPVVSPLLNR